MNRRIEGPQNGAKSDSDDEEYAPAAKRQKRHKFKTFAQRVAHVDVDVYRSLGTKRAEPISGASSFFQERLNAWRELNAASDWLQAAAALQPLCHSLPQLLHHQDEILRILLSKITLDSILSLEAFLDLIAALARDLQHEFVPHMEAVIYSLSDLVDLGADREPELLGHIFTSISLMCKHLCKHLVEDLPSALATSARLRYHNAEHVRVFAAQAYGYLLRHASRSSMRAAIRAVLADAVVRPSVARLQGAGFLFAEAVTGVNHSLHSRASDLLALFLQDDLLSARDFQPSKAKMDKKRVLETFNDQQPLETLSAEALAARVAAVASCCLQKLLDHVRRGPGVVPLWSVLEGAVALRLDVFEAETLEPEGSLSDLIQSHRYSAARGIILLAETVSYHRGSRVQSYQSLFHLATRLLRVLQTRQTSGVEGGLVDDINRSDSKLDTFHRYFRPSLTKAVLEYLQALVYAHCKVAGSSEGPIAIQRVAPLWSNALTHVPLAEALTFVRALISPPAGPEVARGFTPQIIATVGRGLLSGHCVDVCWPVLMDVCAVLGGDMFQSRTVVPVILGAPGDMGPRLAAFIIDNLRKACSRVPSTEAHLHVAWAALHCLPYAVNDLREAVELFDELLPATRSALQEDTVGRNNSTAPVPVLTRDVLVVHTALWSTAALLSLEQTMPEDSIERLLDEAVHLLAAHPNSFHVVHAVSMVLDAVVGRITKMPALEQVLPQIGPGLTYWLSSPSSAMRRGILRVFCTFGAMKSQNLESSAGPSDVLQQLLAVESKTLGVDAGRPAVVALGRVKNYLEFKRVPEPLIPLVVRSLLGVLHLRFAPLWPAASAALGAALDAHPDIAWPVIFEQLSEAQKELLEGGSSSAGMPGAGDQEEDGWDGAKLKHRFKNTASEGSVEASGGSVDAATRLASLLRAVGAADSEEVEKRARDWVPLFLKFSAAKTPDGITSASGIDDDADQDEELAAKDNAQTTCVVPTRTWRSTLREWLTVVGGLRGLRGMYLASHLQGAVMRHCLDSDTSVQQASLKCLKGFKLPWLTPYLPRLLRLVDDKTLRAELAAFPLAGTAPTSARKGDDVDSLLPEHRPQLVPLLIALLFPKMRKRSGRLGGKGAPGSARAAILNFLSGAETKELGSLLELFLGPLGDVFVPPETEIAVLAASQKNNSATWWASKLGTQKGSYWMSVIDEKSLNGQPLRRRIGYLNALEDLLKHLGHGLQQYLPELLALTTVLFEGAVNEQEATDDSATQSDSKEVRSKCLRSIASIVQRFPKSCDYGFLWARLLPAATPLMGKISIEAAADKPPPLVELCCALAGSQDLVGVLADGGGPVHEPATAASSQRSTFVEDCHEAWAQEHHLGSKLFSRCLGALSAGTCGEPTRWAVLGALESIFDLADPLPDLILEPHRTLILSGLQSIISASYGASHRGGSGTGDGSSTHLVGRNGRKHLALAVPRRSTAARALVLLELVCGRASDVTTAGQLTDALLPLLVPNGGSKKSSDEELVGRALAALTALWNRLRNSRTLDSTIPQNGAETQAKSSQNEETSHAAILTTQKQRLVQVAAALAPLAGSLSSRNAREALCAAAVAIGALLLEFSPAGELLSGLNAMSTTNLDEPDYDARTAAYGKLTPEMWASLDRLAAAPIIQHCARDLRDAEDLALRHAAAHALGNLIDAAATSGGIGPSTTLETVQKYLFPQLKRGVGATSLAVRQEHLALVRRLAVGLPGNYPDLVLLAHAEAEADFWLNAAHIQLHRRARAFARLARSLKEAKNDESALPAMGILMGFILPILQQAILENKGDADDAGHESKQSDKDRGANVVDAANSALGAVASTLPWVQYQQVLGQYLRLMARHAEGPGSKAVLRAVCTVLDAFHFNVLANNGAAETAETEDGDGTEEDGAQELQNGAMIPGVPHESEVLRMLSRRVVPELRSQMVVGETVRAPVAQAVVKVLKLLPASIMRAELPRTLQLVANLLKLRLQRLRDDARAVLVSMARDLGPEYLPFIIEVLRSALPERGFTAHVLGYTTHAVLEAVVGSKTESVSLEAVDECLPMILPIVENDLFGTTSEAKEVDAFASSYKEAKRCRANETFQLLASAVTFSTAVPQLLMPVRTHLGEASNPKVRTKLGLLLQHASRGLLANPTAMPHDICELVYGVAHPALEAEESARSAAKSASGAAVGGDNDGEQEQLQETTQRALHQPLFTEFALTTLQAALKKGVIPAKGSEAAALLEPLLPVLVRALRSRHAPTVTAALQSLSLLFLYSDAAALGPLSSDVGKAITEVLKRCPKTTHPVAQDCFKLLAGMLRQCERFSLSASQLRFLLGWAFTDLEESAERQTAFALLRAILARKLVVPEVYDLMERVQELVVRSQAAQVRQLASSSLLAFLLDYPLAPPRLQAHLQFFLANLGYEHEVGREAVLDMVSVIVEKFPLEVISGWTESIFLPLVTRLVNDPSSKCKAAAAGVVKKIISRVPMPVCDRIASFCVRWMEGGDPRLLRAAAQALGLFLDVEGAAAERRISLVLTSVADVLEERSTADTFGNGADDDQEGRVPGWQEAYHCLALLEKAMSATPAVLSWDAAVASQRCWRATAQLLLHPHAWVRKASGRLIGAGLADSSLCQCLLRDTLRSDLSPGALALSFFRQLDSHGADEAMAGQAVKCLVYLTAFMFDDDFAASRVPGRRSHSSKPLEEGDAEQVNEVDEDDAADMAAASEMADGVLSLAGLARRMIRLADDKSYVRQLQRGVALRFIAATASRLGRERAEPYLPILLRPLFRITEPGATGNSEEIKSLASEIVEHLRSLMGAETFLAGYNAAREVVRRTRVDRRQKAAVQTLVDPEAVAKRKIRAAERKAAGKRKALEQVRRMRSAGVVVKNKKKQARGGRGMR